MDRDSEPDLAVNAKAIHEAKEVIREEVPSSNKKSMNDVLAKYGLGK